MGLDKDKGQCFNRYVTRKLLLDSLGYPARGGVKGYLQRLLGRRRGMRLSPLRKEEQSYMSEVKDQFLKLAEKGIAIPVFTL